MDVVVVGAGPAGAAVASGLADAGLRVTVLEKSQLPRYKACSGGIPAKVRPWIPLPDAEIDDLVEDTIRRVRFTYRNRDPVVVESEQDLVYIVRRDVFDHRLISDAARKGARILDGVEVLGVDPSGRRARIRTTKGEFSAALVIGADGVHSAVARSMGIQSSEKLGFALQAEVPVDAATLESWRGTVGGDFGHLPHGIGWVFPKSDHLSVGLLSFSRRRGWKREQLFEFLQGQGLEVDPSKARVYGHFLPRWHGQTVFHDDKVLLLGDAAGIVNPMTGAGIGTALRSAAIAVEVIKSAVLEGNDRLPIYSERVGREITREFLDVRAMAKLFFNFSHACYQLGIKRTVFNEIAARLLTGTMDYTDVWSEALKGTLTSWPRDRVDRLKQKVVSRVR